MKNNVSKLSLVLLALGLLSEYSSVQAAYSFFNSSAFSSRFENLSDKAPYIIFSALSLGTAALACKLAYENQQEMQVLKNQVKEVTKTADKTAQGLGSIETRLWDHIANFERKTDEEFNNVKQLITSKSEALEILIKKENEGLAKGIAAVNENQNNLSSQLTTMDKKIDTQHSSVMGAIKESRTENSRLGTENLKTLQATWAAHALKNR